MIRKNLGAVFLCIFFVTGVLPAKFVAQGTPDLARIFKDSKKRTGKPPIIFIPGILGSELIHKDTGEKLWFRVSRSKGEDLRLPIALNLELSRDKLVPGDILRKIDLSLFPDIEIYQGLIEALTKYGGYEEASWSNPPKNLEDKFLVFPYDWRRDNVETARYLLEEIEELRRKTKRPNVKFNVLAHSMGGLIARYAAMYGMADLPKGPPRPTWAGEKYFEKIFLFGTPNEGSAGALNSLLKGKSTLGSSVNLPFVRDLSPVDIATMPSVFQLLPHQRSARFYNGNLDPIKIDLFDIEVWRKYGWAIYSSDKHLKDFSEAEIGRFEQYFELVLERARKFHQALDVYSSRKSSIDVVAMGSDCSPTLDAIVVYKNRKADGWITLTRPGSFRNSKGVKVSSDQVKKLMYAPGDGSVTRRSLLAQISSSAGGKSGSSVSTRHSVTSALFVCEAHETITSNPTVQNYLLTDLLNYPKP